jgi:hypothetical protein
MTLRWLIGSLLLAVVLTGCIVVPAYPVAIGRAHYHRHHHWPHHHGYGYGR